MVLFREARCVQGSNVAPCFEIAKLISLQDHPEKSIAYNTCVFVHSTAATKDAIVPHFVAFKCKLQAGSKRLPDLFL